MHVTLTVLHTNYFINCFDFLNSLAIGNNSPSNYWDFTTVIQLSFKVHCELFNIKFLQRSYSVRYEIIIINALVKNEIKMSTKEINLKSNWQVSSYLIHNTQLLH